ncbi:hypothetical protein NV379_02010 [Paenibacillus sp. N1-5-1-14]|uniref:hypothetical protein n=1 Tax=Paenibacillus radicibacter TaxID=2972488 RepID=UPI002159AA89|nr:hypothetical protein [Paenibacillus radicibacter]MCR8641420.1 hypothetical protein [Paenibacillus radicibacter]
MGILNNEVELITDKCMEEIEDDLEIELAEFQSEGWTINDKETAMRIDYVLHMLEEKIAEDEAIAKSQKEVIQAKIDKLEEDKSRYDDWLERSTKGYRNRIADLKLHLHLYHQRLIEAEELENVKRVSNGNKPLKISKSIKLTYRDLVSKQQQPEIIKNDELLKDWIVDNYSSYISYAELAALLERKEAEEVCQVSVRELEELISKNNSEYVKRDVKVNWGEFKKTLQLGTKNIKETLESGEEVVVGTKLIYCDENGVEIPNVTLIDQGVKFDWKLNK